MASASSASACVSTSNPGAPTGTGNASSDDRALERSWRALVLHRAVVDDVLATLGGALGSGHGTTALSLRLGRASEAAAANAAVLERAATAAGAPRDAALDANALSAAARGLPGVSVALRALAADWSTSGAAWRDALYAPVVDAVAAAAADDIDDHEHEHGDYAEHAEYAHSGFRVLVPGAGAGRLCWELARRVPSASVQGCESRFQHLFLANLALNELSLRKPSAVFPWALRVDGQCVEEGEEIPDVDPAALPADAELSMCAGEFANLYTEEAAFACVATVGFLELQRDVVSTARRIARVLRHGGVWVNHGNFNFAENALAPTEDELFRMLPRLGLRVVAREARNIPRLEPHTETLTTTDTTCFFVAVRL